MLFMLAKISGFEVMKPPRKTSSTSSTLSTSTLEHAMCLSRRFLHTKGENKRPMETTRFWLWNRHLQRQKAFMMKTKVHLCLYQAMLTNAQTHGMAAVIYLFLSVLIAEAMAMKRREESYKSYATGFFSGELIEI